MTRAGMVHLDGRLVPAGQAMVSPFDRGFLFGHGVYEGLRAEDGRVVALHRHVERLRASLEAARIEPIWPVETLGTLTTQLLEANELAHAFVYWQVTAGPPPAGAPVRERTAHADAQATVFGYCVPEVPLREVREPRRVRARTVEDTRWTRGRIKSTSLLGNVLAACEAQDAGGDDAIMVRSGLVCEGTATNVFVRTGGQIATPSLDSVPILAGVTRELILEADASIEVRAVQEYELQHADEVILVGTRTGAASVVELDGRTVGGGEPGTAARGMLEALREAARGDTDAPVRTAGVHSAS